MQELIWSMSIDSAEEFRKVIKSASELAKKERSSGGTGFFRVFGDLVEIENFSNLIAVGDLHGDSNSLSSILQRTNCEEFLEHPGNILVFLGDYVDRGNESMDVLKTVCALKSKFPSNVVLMRGNHEAPKQLPFSSHDLPYKVEEEFGAKDARRIYGDILELFEFLTLAVIVRNQMIIVHGGLPVEIGANYRESLAKANQLHSSSSFMEEVLWSDPRELGATEWENSRRGFGKHFGKDVTTRWLSQTRTRFVLRGHEPCKAFRIDHDGKVLTLFSSKEAYPSFEAGYLKISESEMASCTNATDLSTYVQKLDL